MLLSLLFFEPIVLARNWPPLSEAIGFQFYSYTREKVFLRRDAIIDRKEFQNAKIIIIIPVIIISFLFERRDRSRFDKIFIIFEEKK